MAKSLAEIVGRFIGIVIAFIIACALGCWLWNDCLLAVFPSIPTLTFWQFTGLMLLVRIIMPSRTLYNTTKKQ